MEEWTKEEEESMDALVNVDDDLLWDDPDFLAKLAEAESSIATSSFPNPNSFPIATTSGTPPATFLYHPPQPLSTAGVASSDVYSPPRQLLQPLPVRPVPRRETDGRAEEWGRVLEQRNELVFECVEPRKKENSRRDGRGKPVVPLSQQNSADIYRHENTSIKFEVRYEDAQLNTAKCLVDQIGERKSSEIPTLASIGVQTDQAGDTDDEWSSSHDLSRKLQDIWGCRTNSNFDRNVVSWLFTACPAEFQVLSACMTVNESSKMLVGLVNCTHADRSSCSTSESARVSHLYSILSQISNGMLLSEALFEPLLDLCDHENVAIVHSSLHILHVLLKHLLSSRHNLIGRDNVRVEEFHSGANAECKSVSNLGVGETSCSGFDLSGARPPNRQTLPPTGYWTVGSVLSRPCENWISIYELVNQVVLKHSEECIRLEAVSIMNVILMITNACMERDLFGQILVFRSIGELLKKKTSSKLRKEALHLLYLLLNCSTVLSKFCCGCKEECVDVSNDAESTSTMQGFSRILEGLADCLTCCGGDIHSSITLGNFDAIEAGSLRDLHFMGILKDVKLRKRAIITLAYLFSSGKSGFEILMYRKSTAETNFLLLILQAVVSEMDVVLASHSSDPADCVKARTLLIREALILLNRLVSSPVYSATILLLLTSSRDMASLALDIASRSPRKDPKCRQFKNSLQREGESEIIGLIQVFRKRIFAYFGDATQ